jgi:hypothetical protein
VKFEFAEIGSGGTQTCTILERQNAVVIDIPRQDGIDPCLIVGVQQEHVFSGENTLHLANTPRIQARWTKLGPRFVGVWIEEGNDSFFWFELSRRATKADKNTSRHKNVAIEFLPLSDGYLLNGNVMVRKDLMRIKLYEAGEFPGMTFEGNNRRAAFTSNVGPGITATWSSLLGGFIGIIGSNEDQSLFSFRLIEARQNRRNRRKGH